MALLHYFHLLYQHTLALAADSTASTPSNKLKILVALVALLTYKYRSHPIGTRRRDDLKEPKGARSLLWTHAPHGVCPRYQIVPHLLEELSRTGSGLVDFFAGDWKDDPG
ncbi:hypothetical protein F5H01DRAFT_318993 [Linnemannia elongata]|nr:hypothetical protein F5H01DRAFT_318993 [Linnemannia elongata]